MGLDRNEKIAVTVGILVVFGVLLGGTMLSQMPISGGTMADQQRFMGSVSDSGVMSNTVNSMPQELTINDVVQGAGDVATAGKQVSVHYTGMLQDGTVFDTSRQRGQPFTFTLGAGAVIPGWETGIDGMRIGGQRRLTIPPEYAYGAGGIPGAIPPNATLIFDVELLGVK